MKFAFGAQPQLLSREGQALLLGTFAWTLILAMRGKLSLSEPFERLAVGFLALTFFVSGAAQLMELSQALLTKLIDPNRGEDLRVLILELLHREPVKNGPDAGNNFSFAAEAWRTGVWGVMTALVEGVFLLVSFVLECAYRVLWALLLTLYPLGCGLYPLFPGMLKNLSLYGIELSLWLPFLALVERVTAAVARDAVGMDGSLGLPVIAIQVIAILLIILIPTLTHRFLSGAFSGDFDTQSKTVNAGRSVVTRVVQLRKGRL